MKQSTLGPYIRSLRTQNHMTQVMLAAKLGVTDKAVSKWERDLSYPDIALFPKLADCLGVSVNDLLNESIDEEHPSRLEQIYEMSSDFRTPLHMILGCVDMAEMHIDDRELMQKYLQSIRISGEYLLKTINRAMEVVCQAVSTMHVPPGSENAATLEASLKEPPGSRVSIAERFDFSGKRILIAEDMELNREIAGELLKQTGAVTEFAVDGQTCLDRITEAPAGYYDLVLMDIAMPNMDGLEATRRIRQLPDAKKASVPIVAVTANACERDRKLAMESGMDAFTEKPFFMDRLFETMKQFLYKT